MTFGRVQVEHFGVFKRSSLLGLDCLDYNKTGQHIIPLASLLVDQRNPIMPSCRVTNHTAKPLNICLKQVTALHFENAVSETSCGFESDLTDF